MTETPMQKLLLVEDNPGDVRLLREMLNEAGSHKAELTEVSCMGEAEAHLAERAVDAILLDPGLPDSQGLETVRRARAAAPHIALVVLTGLDDESLAAQALQEGAQDYLVKGQFETRGLLQAIRYAIERNVMQEESKRLARLKDEFVATVSHELRTPLTSICGSIALLTKTGGDRSDLADRLLPIAHTNCQRLTRLIDDILDIEKMESGKVVFHFRCIQVRGLAEQMIEANRRYADGFGVHVRLEDKGPLAEVRADRDRLGQVLTNLLSNAVKFSSPDTEVVLAIEKSPGQVRISVRNHGPGIAADFKPHIFERFAQADATSARQKGGTGLGLSIVKQIVDRLGGAIGFADMPGGTIFHVDLPCWEHQISIALDHDAPAELSRILLCEDEPDTAVVLRAQLRQAGFATDFAYTAADALALAATTRYRAILVDLLLPDGDGIDLVVRLRDLPQYSDTPVIVVSVDPRRGRNDPRSSKLNIFHWLSKPVNFDHLVRALTATSAPNTVAPGSQD
jgi:signal transduction histidine kinase